jgi:predicted anti-sigma-YlaC factor YlaD
MGAVQHPECERARLWVSLSLDGELSEIEQVSLRAHVGRCAACAAFEHDVDALTVELRNAPLVPPATAVTGGRAVPIALPRRRSTAMRVLQISAAAAAVVLAAGLGSLAGSLSSGGTPTATTVARTAGGNLGARIDRGIVAMAPAQKLPASRIRPTVAI